MVTEDLFDRRRGGANKAEVNQNQVYSLRQATAADYDFLYGLLTATMKEYIEATWGWDEEFQRQRFADHFNPAKSNIVIARGRDVGQLSVIQKDDEIFLSGIFILPAYQGQGLGTTIINDVVAQAREKGLPVGLRVLRSNPARQLYKRLGFKIVEENDVHFIMSHAV